VLTAKGVRFCQRAASSGVRCQDQPQSRFLRARRPARCSLLLLRERAPRDLCTYDAHFDYAFPTFASPTRHGDVQRGSYFPCLKVAVAEPLRRSRSESRRARRTRRRRSRLLRSFKRRSSRTTFSTSRMNRSPCAAAQFMTAASSLTWSVTAIFLRHLRPVCRR
jgi:hypothetical protein